VGSISVAVVDCNLAAWSSAASFASLSLDVWMLLKAMVTRSFALKRVKTSFKPLLILHKHTHTEDITTQKE
jgi:hypothetical protein